MTEPGHNTRLRIGMVLRFASLVLVPAWFWTAWKLGFIARVMSNETAAFSYAGLLVLYLCTKPTLSDVGLVVLCGAVVRVATRDSAPVLNDFPFAAPVHYVALAGLVSVGALLVRSAVGRARRASVEMLFRVLIFVVLGVTIGQIVGFASHIRPLKMDLYLYAVDRAFGLPSFAAGRLFAASPALQHFELLIYYSLPFALSVLYAAHLIRPQAGVDILFLLYMNALVGFGMYLIYPACGPIYAFGANYPYSAPGAGPLTALAVSCSPNAMPSLHVAGALLVVWNSRAFRSLRVASFGYLALTALATLGFGEHYLIDLVVCIPYALLLQAIATESDNRPLVMSIGIGFVLAWLAVLQFGVPTIVGRPVILWLLTAATMALCGWSKCLLDSQTQVGRIRRWFAPKIAIEERAI